MTIRTVFLDIGETIIDETRLWANWADWLGISHFTFFALLGGVIERREPQWRAMEIVRPGFDLKRERAARAAAGAPDAFTRADLYPDAVPCLSALHAEGYRIGLAGNQPRKSEQLLREMALPVDVVATSADWGVEKPSPGFFARMVEAAQVPAQEIAYVGDRVDNDVLPAVSAGMVAVFLRRGPWGYLQADRPEAAQAHIRLDALTDLPAALRSYRPSLHA